MVQLLAFSRCVCAWCASEGVRIASFMDDAQSLVMIICGVAGQKCQFVTNNGDVSDFND